MQFFNISHITTIVLRIIYIPILKKIGSDGSVELGHAETADKEKQPRAQRDQHQAQLRPAQVKCVSEWSENGKDTLAFFS